MHRRKAVSELRRSLRYSIPFRVGIMLATSTLSGCGGGGGSVPPPPTPPSQDFSLSVSSASLKLVAGASAFTSVTVTGSNGFTSPVTIGITGLPSGVSISPASLQVTPGQSEQLTFTAAAYVSSSTTSLTLAGSSGALSHTATLNLAVAPYAGNISFPRTRYTRTDAATPYFLWGNSNWIVFDSTTSRFFVTDPSTNQIMVLDAATQTEIGTITVPGAFGIDETPDHTTLYVGTQIGDIYAIDPVGMKVVHRYIASEIGPSGYQAYSVRVLANGNLALLGGQGGIPGVDGYGGFAIWSPTDNSITIYGAGGPPASNCTSAGHIFELTLTGDKTSIVLSAGNSLCTLNAATGQVNFAPVVGFPIAPTSDGKSLLVLQPGGATPTSPPAQILVLDARTLSQTATIQLTAYTTDTTAMFVSPDSTTVFIGEGGTDTPIVYAYNIATGAQIGWLPNLFLSPIVGGPTGAPINSPDFQAIDNTGLLAGPMEEGVGFLDTAALRTGPVGTQFLNAYLNPATGPVAGGTQLQIPSSENLDALYFGKNLASSISQIGNGLFEATTPPGPPGYVDVYGMMTDGGVQILPEAFSYGPAILEATPNSSTAEGGGTGILYGYGFGPTDSNTIPTDLQVTIGGKQALITSYIPNAYGVGAPPFLLESVSYTIPAGVSGGSADITVTTEAGSATLSAGMSYFPATQQFSLTGAVLAQGIYDATRDLYYFTDATEIRVFSKTQGQWLTPIQVPPAPSGTTHRLWGIALSPDGSKLAVCDANSGLIYVINPGVTGAVQSFPLATKGQAPWNPFGVAISDSGIVYIAAQGYPASYLKLDTSSGTVSNYNIVGAASNDMSRVAISADNSKVFFNNDGAVFSINTGTDTVSYAAEDPGCCRGDYDLTLSAGQSTLEATSYLYDTNLNAESYLALNDREALNITYVYGTKLNPGGNLLFQPFTSGIDVYDGRLGVLRSRIALPFPLSQNYDALVGDGKDNILIAITGANGNGIAIVDLTSLSEPAPLPYLKDFLAIAHAPGSNERSSLRVAPGNQASGMAVQSVVPRSVIKHVTNERLVRDR